MKVGITGGSGFIGSHVAECFVQAGHDVLLLDHKGRTYNDLPHMLGDVRDRTVCHELVAHVDAVVHLAGVLGTAETLRDPLPAVETNMLGVVNMLDACLTWDIPLAAVSVGNFQMLNTYSTTKVAAEKLVLQMRNELGLRAAVIRPVNAYGPRQAVAPPHGAAKVRKIFPSFATRAICGEPVQLYGDGTQISDMVWVGDVARTFLATIEHLMDGKVPEHIIECGPEDSLTVVEIAQVVVNAVEHRLGLTAPIEYLPMRAGEATGGLLPIDRVDDLHRLLVDLGVNTHVARQVVRPLSNRVNADSGTLLQVGIKPQSLLSFEEGAERSIDWYIEQEGTAWNR